MSAKDLLAEPKSTPSLHIPESPNTVTVRVIDTTSNIFLPDQTLMFTPQIEPSNSINCPAYSFLITHGDRHIIFDLGTWPPHLTPFIKSKLEKNGWAATADKHVAQILDESASFTGVSSKDVEAVIWSHHHWDHTGFLDAFPSSTSLVVGPGFKQAHLPGYPTNPNSPLQQPDFENRTVREIDFKTEGNGMTIGRCSAFDYFGDGSFYVLDSPGHTVGHICGLARVSSSPSTFVLMGGDASHNMGEMRPTEYLPLPKAVKPSPLPRYAASGCPGEMLLTVHPKGDAGATQPFYTPADGFNADNDEAKRTLVKLEEMDADQHVLVVLAHDKALLGDLPLFPGRIDNWFEQALDARTRWNFLGPFGEALKQGGKDI